jgi:hypothetical protein
MNPLPEVSPACPGLASENLAAGPGDACQRLDPLEFPGWDKLIRSRPDASFFHGASWARVLHDTYGHVPHYFCARQGDRLCAALPVLEVNSPVTGKRGVSLPFTDECGCLSEDANSAREVFREAIDFGRRRGWRYLECRGGRNVSETCPPSLSFFGHVLAMAGGEERLFRRLDSSVRRAIRKAESAKVEVVISRTFDSLQTYYSLHCRTRKKHGLPPQSFTFFRNIFEHVLARGQGFIAEARHENKPVAAAVFFHDDNKAIYKFGASDPAYQHLRANNLIMWQAIKWYSANRYASLHFGRTSLANEGLRRFKLGFGTAEHRIDYFKYDLRKDDFVADRDKVFGWFNGVFRLMPMPVSRMVGRLLYRHLS